MNRLSSIWTTSAAVIAAVLSSACCWLPLLLLSFGASAAGIAGFFEAYRGYFLAATALLLGVAFYLVYFRARRCAPGESCAVPNPKLQRINKVLLWVATGGVLAFAFFPHYVGVLLGSPSLETSAEIDRAGLVEFVFELDGMTCEACAAHTQASLKKLPGVRSVEVSYAEKRAAVLAEPSLKEDDLRIAVEAAGYKIRTLQSIVN